MYQKISEQLVNKEQLQIIYKAWGTDAEIPKAKTKSLVCWPHKEHAEITKVKSIGDYKGSMFKIEFFKHCETI